MLFGKRRVEEDLERIRQANLPEKYAAEQEQKVQEKASKEERVGAKDVFAMIIAVFSIILPYVLGFVAIMGLLILGWTLWIS